MGLGQSIVVVNRFTIADASGGGTRGATPGKYVERYMGRDEATEPLLPVQHEGVATYLEHYVAREGAVESAVSLTDAMEGVACSDRLDGIAFDGDSVSLSKDDFIRVSRQLQGIFDAGQPVLECVLSFDTDYLRQTQLIDPLLPEGGRGYLKGQVDQLKLRRAIQEGIRSLSHGFASLTWVGVLQFDTQHVHAHLALAETDVERSPRLRNDGTYMATLSEQDKQRIRLGIDRELDLTRELPHLSASISNQRRNVRSFVGRYAVHELMGSGDVQLVMAVLPQDASLWRAGSNRREMRRANELTRNLVHQAFEQPESGYAEVERLVNTYAERRSAREGAGDKRRQQLVEQGLARVETECVNEVYRGLRQIRDRPVHTRAIDIMATDVSEAARLSEASKGDEMWFRLRTYGGRLNAARDARREFHEERRRWEQEHATGQTSEQSRLMYAYYVAEERYQSQVMAKYQNLLPLSLLGYDDEDDMLDDVIDAKRRLDGLEGLLMDPQVLSMGTDALARYGLETYGVRHAEQLVTAPQLYVRRVEAARERFEEACAECEFTLAEHGRALVVPDVGQIRTQPRTLYRFDEVRGVDMHNLRYDFTGDVPVGSQALGQFTDAAYTRASTLVGCIRYLKGAGRDDVVARLPVREVIGMQRLSEQLQMRPVLTSARTDAGLTVPRHTVRTEPEVAASVSHIVLDAIARERESVRADIEGLGL